MKLFSKLKDKTNKNVRSNLVYSIECSCNRKYIGQTSQWIKNRIAGHKSDIKKNNYCIIFLYHCCSLYNNCAVFVLC